jgi:hypothetical protein
MVLWVCVPVTQCTIVSSLPQSGETERLEGWSWLNALLCRWNQALFFFAMRMFWMCLNVVTFLQGLFHGSSSWDLGKIPKSKSTKVSEAPWDFDFHKFLILMLFHTQLQQFFRSTTYSLLSLVAPTVMLQVSRPWLWSFVFSFLQIWVDSLFCIPTLMSPWKVLFF